MPEHCQNNDIALAFHHFYRISIGAAPRQSMNLMDWGAPSRQPKRRSEERENWISDENQQIQIVFEDVFRNNYDERRRPQRGAPAAVSGTAESNNPDVLPCLKRDPETGNSRTIMDFHCSGVNFRSYRFQKSRISVFFNTVRFQSGIGPKNSVGHMRNLTKMQDSFYLIPVYSGITHASS